MNNFDPTKVNGALKMLLNVNGFDNVFFATGTARARMALRNIDAPTIVSAQMLNVHEKLLWQLRGHKKDKLPLFYFFDDHHTASLENLEFINQSKRENDECPMYFIYDHKVW